jgi:hypothetical protein
MIQFSGKKRLMFGGKSSAIKNPQVGRGIVTGRDGRMNPAYIILGGHHGFKTKV